MKTWLPAAVAALLASAATVGAQQTLTAFASAVPTANLPLSGTDLVLVIQNGVIRTAAVGSLPENTTTVKVSGTPTAGNCVTWINATTIGDGGIQGGCLLAK